MFPVGRRFGSAQDNGAGSGAHAWSKRCCRSVRHQQRLQGEKADGGEAVLFANLGTGTFKLSQLGTSTARASGYNVWKNTTSTFSGVILTVAAGQTETTVIKPIGG
ncbi:hypothetical protein [Dactylosporangium sp. CA-092794]|uniref:hypothetical protein n=1 Tax=Dactylosporangium sp. CA-092794 TaxID=3239929 RepID=UPI003D8CD317